jgi:hypothetical protein
MYATNSTLSSAKEDKMDEHTCRYGNKRRRRIVRSYDELLGLPTTERPDDGLVVPLPDCPACKRHDGYAPAHTCPRVNPTCPDCGRGTLMWAEAGYVPWHRICSVCGSHWDLHPRYPDGYIRRARFYR